MRNKSKADRALEIKIEQDFISRGRDAIEKEFEEWSQLEIKKGVLEGPIREAVLKKIGRYETKQERLYNELRYKFLFPEFYKKHMRR